MENRIKETIHHLLKTLECPICLEVLEDPVSTTCHHQFCRQCIIKVINTNNVKNQSSCPMCKTNISKRGLREKPFLSEVLATTKEIAKAIKLDSGIDVSPPKWSSCSGVNAVANSCSIEAFHRAHPSPHKPSSTGNNKRSIKEDPSVNATNKRFKSSTVVYNDGNTLDNASGMTISNTNIRAGFPAGKKKQINSDKAIPLLLPLNRSGKENVTISSPSTFRLDFFPTEASSSRISDDTSLINKPAPNTLLNAHFDQMKKLPNNESSKTDAIHNSSKTYARKKFDKTRLSTSCLGEMDITEKVSQWLTTQSTESGMYLDTSSVDSSHLGSSKKFFKSKDSFYQDSQAVLPKPFPDEDPYAFISSQKTPPKTKKGAKPKRGRKHNKNPSVLVTKNKEMVKKLSEPSTSKQRQPFTNLEDDNDFVTTKTIREKVVKMQPPAPKVNFPDSLVEPDDDLDDIVLFQTPACDITDYSNKNGTFVNSDNENESEFGITKKRSKVGKKGGGTVKKSRKSKDPNLPSTQEQIDRMNEKLAEAENFELNIEYTDTKRIENRIQSNKFDKLDKPNDNFIIADSENILSRKEMTKSPIKAFTLVESIQSPRKPLGQANRLNEGDVYVLETGSKKTPSKISTPDSAKSLKPAIILKNIVPLGITILQESKSTTHNNNGDLILVNNPGKSKLELPPLLSRNIAALSHFDKNLEPVIDVKSDTTDKTEIYSPDIKSKHPENSLDTEFAPNNIGDLETCEGHKSTIITDLVLKKRNCFSTSTEIDPVETARPNLDSSSDISFSNIQLLQSPIMNIVDQVEISKDSSSKLELEESSKLELEVSSKLENKESSKLKPSNESIPKPSKDHRTGSSRLQLEESTNTKQEPVTISEKQSSSTNDFLLNEEQCVEILHEITTTVDVFNSIQETESLKIINVGMENIDTSSSSMSIASNKSLDSTKEKIKGFITQLFETDESDTPLKEEYSTNEDVISDCFINEKNVNENIIEPMEVEQSCESNNSEEMVQIVISVPKKALLKCASNVDSENVQMGAIGYCLKLHYNADIKFDPQKNAYYVNSGSISLGNQPSFLVGSNTNIFKDIEAQTDVTSSNSKSVGTLTDNSIFENVPSVSNSTVQTDSTIKVMENFEAQTEITLSSRSVSTETETSMNDNLPEMGSQTELTMSCLDLLFKNVDSHSTLKNFEFPNLMPNHYGVALQTSKIEGLNPSWGSIPENLSPMFPSNTCTSLEGESEEPKNLGSINNKNENPSKSIVIDVEQKVKSFNVENDHSTMKSDNFEDQIAVKPFHIDTPAIKSVNIEDDQPVLKSLIEDDKHAIKSVNIEDDQLMLKSIIEKNQTAQEQVLNGETITIQVQEDIFQSSPFTNENTTVNENNPSIVSKAYEIIPSAEKIPHEILARFFSQSALNDTEDTNMDFNQSIHSDSRSSDHGENGHDTKLEDDFLQDNDSFIIGKEHDDLFVEKFDFDKVIEKPVEMNVEETDDQFGNESTDIFGITIINQKPPEHKSPKKHTEDNDPKEETLPDYSPQSFPGKVIEIKRDAKSPESPLVPVRRASRLSRKKRIDKSFSSNSSNSYSTKNSGKLLSGTCKSPLNGIPERNKRITNVKGNDYCDLPNDESTRKSPLKAICQENAKKIVNFDTTNYRDISSDEASNLEGEHPTKARIDEVRANQMDDDDSLPDSNEQLQNLLRNNYSVRDDDPSMKAAESIVAPLQSSLMKRNIEQPNLRNQKLFSNLRELNEKRLDSTSGENSSPLIRKETKKFVRQLNYDSPSDSTASWKPATRKFIKNRVISDSDSESEPEIPVVLISTDSEVDTPKTAMKKVLDNIQRDLDLEVTDVKPPNEDVELSTEDFDLLRDDVEPTTDDIIENRVDCTSTMSFTGSNLVEQQMKMDSLRKEIAVLKSLFNGGATQQVDDNSKAQTPKKDDQVPNDESPKNSQDDGNESEDIFDSEIPPTPLLKSKKGSGNFLH